MKSIIDVGIHAAKEAGMLLQNKAGSIKNVSIKEDRSLVTDIDKKSEKIIVDIIHDAFPSHGILAEESGNDNSTGEYLWIIDPIDGTHNYIREIPLYGVSIGVVHKEHIIAGVIYLPAFDALYVAEKGSGAFKNNRPIRVSGKADLHECTLCYDSSFRNNGQYMTDVLAVIGKEVFNLRMFGTSAVMLAYLAEGRVDCIIEFDDKPWDFTAGICLITEAGGRVSRFNGKPVTYTTQGYCATNGLVHDSLIKYVAPFVEQ